MTETIQTARQAEILRLAQDAKALAQDARDQVAKATQAAIDCGRLLAQEKAEFKARKKQGLTWGDYYEAHFGQQLPAAMGNRYMALQLQLEGLEDTKAETLPTNVLRSGASIAGAYPPKVHDQPPGSDIPLPKRASHLILILKFNSWKRELDAKTKGRLSSEQKRQFLRDFAPIYAFLQSLEGKADLPTPSPPCRG